MTGGGKVVWIVFGLLAVFAVWLGFVSASAQPSLTPSVVSAAPDCDKPEDASGKPRGNGHNCKPLDVTVEPTATTAPPTSTPQPTDTPAPTSTPAPTNTPQPTNTPLTQAIVENTPTPPPTSTATASPTATIPPTPEPTARAFVALAAATATPEPSPTPTATATPIPPAATPPPNNPVADVLGAFQDNTVANFLSSFPGLGDLSSSPAVIATNLTLALIALILILAAATIFNATIKENSERIEASLARVLKPAAAFGGIAAISAGRQQHKPAWTVIQTVVLLMITAFIYAGLDPNIGFNDTSLALVISLMASLIFTTFLYEGGQVLSSRRLGANAGIRIYPIAILIAAGSVLISRVTDLHPGVIFGFVASAAVLSRSSLDRSRQGLIVFAPMLGLLAASFVAFLLIEPLRELSKENSSAWASVPETIAVAVFVGGAESALLSLIPVTFNDGQKIWAWNKLAWAGLTIPASFMFFHIVVNRDNSYDSAIASEGVMALLITCAVMLVMAIAVWFYFRQTNRQVST